MLCSARTTAGSPCSRCDWARTLPVVSVRRVLAIAEYLYRTHGWTYNQKDPYTGEVIADGTHRQAARYAAGSIPGGKQDVWFAPEITAAADAIIERLQNYEAPADDEFAQALVYAVNFEFLPERKASLIAYAGQFLRNLDQKAAFEARKATMKHIGTVGVREVFELTCKGVTTREGDYGTTYITRFRGQGRQPGHLVRQ